jgi:4-hydroxy-3-methylbut-2-enyl diphosphate reductase
MRIAARVPGLAAAVSNLGEPAAPTPPSGGLSHSPEEITRPLPGGAILARGLVQRVILASPRGYCAGVERAVDTVERALELYGEPVYVRKQIVHNSHVVRELSERGAVFVDSVEDVPEGATLVFSAHGVAPSVRGASEARGLRTIDATCPLVTKVHTQARRYADAGYAIVLIGHAGHEEVEGTTGEAPQAIVLVESVADAEALEPPQAERLAYITQTTLSVDETHAIVDVLRRRFPHIEGPEKEDICYATSNRQWAVKELLGEVELLLVIGSLNSSNSNRLVEVAEAIDDSWFDGVEVVGVTSGASAPERLVQEVCDWFRRRGVPDVAEHGSVYEDVVFKLPPELRRSKRPAAA